MTLSRCMVDGTLDESRFNEPMPWIGLYVVAASVACSLAMALDTIHGFRLKKLWFPCKYFALNATTLTLIGVAVKLSVDLNTSMPRSHDQLAKLSSTAFLCTAIGNSMPSLGAMETKELMMNVVALGILVVTVIVNICIQLGTGVIYEFWFEHAVLLALLMILFAIVISTAIAIPTTKHYLDQKYKKKYKIVKKEFDEKVNTSIARKLRDDAMRWWMMAHTCNPQYVVGRLATCTASGAFCILSTVTLAEAMLRSYLMPWCFTFCNGMSDYKWSTIVILVTQAVAVGLGTIAPASRWFIAIKFRCPDKRKVITVQVAEFSVEHYWIHTLCQLKEFPLNVKICGRRGRRYVHWTKNKILDSCIMCQKIMVLLSQFVRLISIIYVSFLCSFCDKLASMVRCNNEIRNLDAEQESKASSKLDLHNYVLHLEREEGLLDTTMKCQTNALRHWIKIARDKQPNYIIKLLEKIDSCRGFEGVQIFDRDEVPSLDSEEPPNCWALPVVTLTSIAIAISNNDSHSMEELIKCVNESLKYIRVLENELDSKRNLLNVRKAAEVVWVGVDLHDKWLDVDLHEMAAQGRSPREIISQLSDIAKQKFTALKNDDMNGCYTPSRWPVKVLAANAMYRICQALLLIDDLASQCSEAILIRVSSMIADIVGACLTNLQHAISTKCQQSTIEEREECVRFAIILLGKTEKILEMLSGHPLPSSNPEELACINEWRALSKKDREFSSSSPAYSEFDLSPSDLYLNID